MKRIFCLLISLLMAVCFVIISTVTVFAENEVTLSGSTEKVKITADTVTVDIMLKNNTRVEFIEFVQGKSTTNTINKISNKE